MMEVVIVRKVPEHRLTLRIYIVAQEKVICLLPLVVKKRVVVIALEAFHHIS